MESRLMRNILNYYVEEIKEELSCDKAEAEEILKEALQDPDLEYEIIEWVKNR